MTVIVVTGAVVIFDKYQQYEYTTIKLTTNVAVLKDSEHNIEDSIDQGQYSAEHLGLVVCHEIFSVY